MKPGRLVKHEASKVLATTSTPFFPDEIEGLCNSTGFQMWL